METVREERVAGPKVALPKATMRMKLGAGLFALSLANLCLVNAWSAPLYESGRTYFTKMPVNAPTLLALLVNVLGLALVIWCGMRVQGRVQNGALAWTGHVLLVFSFVLPLEFLRIRVFEIADYRVAAFFLKPLRLAGVLTMVALVLWQHRRAAKAAGAVVMILSPLALMTVGKILFLLVRMGFVGQPSCEVALAPLQAVQPGKPRVIWILFDEMDYRLTFEQPLPHLGIPEFKRLRSEVLFATNAFPPADATVASLPALTTGEMLAEVEPGGPSELRIKRADTGQISSWSQSDTVFSDARELGFNTAVVGWFHPYDRLFKREISYCAWYPLEWYEYVRAKSFAESLKRQLGTLGSIVYFRYLYAELCRSSIADALSVVTNQDYGFMFFHLPPPHTPGIWNPQKGEYAIIPRPKPVAYGNNLALADSVVGQMRRALELRGEWERTWLIISSDHSWRSSAVYDGRRDRRVPFIMKAAGSNGPVTFGAEFNTVLTRGLIRGIMEGQITNQQAAIGWMEVHKRKQQPIIGRGIVE